MPAVEEVRVRGGRRRLWLIVSALCALVLAAVALVLSYVFLVVLDAPLGAGSVWDDPQLGVEVPGADPPDTASWVVEYADGATFTLDVWLRNNGRFDLTVTSMPLDPPYWAGLVRATDVRAGVLLGDHCCVLDRQATWAASGFTPFTLKPNEERPLVLRYRLGHCEDNGVGVFNVVRTIAVNYDVLGNGHTTQVPLRERLIVKYGKALECPRPPTFSHAPSSAPPQPAPGPKT